MNFSLEQVKHALAYFITIDWLLMHFCYGSIGNVVVCVRVCVFLITIIRAHSEHVLEVLDEMKLILCLCTFCSYWFTGKKKSSAQILRICHKFIAFCVQIIGIKSQQCIASLVFPVEFYQANTAVFGALIKRNY